VRKKRAQKPTPQPKQKNPKNPPQKKKPKQKKKKKKKTKNQGRCERAKKKEFYVEERKIKTLFHAGRGGDAGQVTFAIDTYNGTGKKFLREGGRTTGTSCLDSFVFRKGKGSTRQEKREIREGEGMSNIVKNGSLPGIKKKAEYFSERSKHEHGDEIRRSV